MSVSDVVTYTAAYAIVPTHACIYRCGYCGFRSDTGKLLTQAQFSRQLELARQEDAAEIHLISGEMSNRLSGIENELALHGMSDFYDFIQDLCISVIDAGFLPHLNIGVVNERRLDYLRHNIASITVMLETADAQVAERIQPGKTIAERIEGIKAAGRARLPLSSGLLLGVGESRESRLQSIDTLADIHAQYGHIQEIILQNFVPNHQSWIPAYQVRLEDYLELVEYIQSALPDVAIQVSPASNPLWLELVSQGVTDLGSILSDTSGLHSRYRSKKIQEYEEQLAQHDILLAQRLPVYPAFIDEHWCSPVILNLAKRILGSQQLRSSQVNQIGLFG